MLDQNTDRMWYVIGAVIVGAALIFLMNGAFPTLFANVGETFEEKVGQTTEMTDGIRPVQKSLFVYEASRVGMVNYELANGTVNIDPNLHHRVSDFIPVSKSELVFDLSYSNLESLRYAFYTEKDVNTFIPGTSGNWGLFGNGDRSLTVDESVVIKIPPKAKYFVFSSDERDMYNIRDGGRYWILNER